MIFSGDSEEKRVVVENSEINGDIHTMCCVHIFLV